MNNRATPPEISIAEITVKTTKEVLPTGAGVVIIGGFVGIVVGKTIVVVGTIVGIGVTVCTKEIVGVGVRVGVGWIIDVGVADGVADCATCVPPANTTKLEVIVFEIPYWSRV